MRRFKIWMEEGLRREQQAQVQKIYDLAVQTLLGSAKDQTHLSLSDLKDDAADGKPPEHKGPLVALGKLNKAGIFDRLKALGNPDLQTRADQAQSYLRDVANNGKVGPKATVGQFLNQLFGDDATETYGNHTWKAAPEAEDQAPQDTQQALQPAVAPPEGQQPPAQAPATGPDVQAPPPAQAAPAPAPAPGVPQAPPMPGQPPAPGDPLQSPGGPMPPPPAGGLPMA